MILEYFHLIKCPFAKLLEYNDVVQERKQAHWQWDEKTKKRVQVSHNACWFNLNVLFIEQYLTSVASWSGFPCFSVKGAFPFRI